MRDSMIVGTLGIILIVTAMLQMFDSFADGYLFIFGTGLLLGSDFITPVRDIKEVK